jgi:hypothetical protein
MKDLQVVEAECTTPSKGSQKSIRTLGSKASVKSPNTWWTSGSDEKGLG